MTLCRSLVRKRRDIRRAFLELRPVHSGLAGDQLAQVGLGEDGDAELLRLLELRSGTLSHDDAGRLARDGVRHLCRSEEHTSELQSLMRNSYAVFCLKTKQYKKTTT